MTRERTGTEELEFLQAFWQRGFVSIPRMLLDYSADLGLNYDTIGKLVTVLTLVGSSAEKAFGPYAISRKHNLHDFDQIRSLALDLEEKELVKVEEDGDRFSFSLIPLFMFLRAIWEEDRQRHDDEQERFGPDPALVAAEKLLGRPLSDREASDIQDWTETYGFGVDMVQAVIREGQDAGVTRMAYLNQIARQWHEEGLRTPEEVQQAQQKQRKSAGKHKSVVQYLGLTRRLTGAEQALLDKWTEEWGFSNEVIIRACAEATGADRPLQYVNRILETWRAENVRTVADAEELMTRRRTAATAAADAGKAARKGGTKPPTRSSNVLLKREKKDDRYYDHIFEKFGK